MSVVEALAVGAFGGLVAALITSAVQLRAVNKTLAYQREAATTEDSRKLRDARSARARKSLGRLLAVALHIQLVADEPILTDAGIREELRKLSEQLYAMWQKMLKARAQVLAEPDGARWMTDFEDLVLRPFRELRVAVGTGDVDRRKEVAAVQNGVAQFQATVSAHLAELDKPM
ncbi:MAG: hypothetical protein DMF54_16905 [Acidobacteria bacterium]|nr:MAG: hypothetical protein DMF54_16905 [Acidobacteriota bacterium]